MNPLVPLIPVVASNLYLWWKATDATHKLNMVRWDMDNLTRQIIEADFEGYDTPAARCIWYRKLNKLSPVLSLKEEDNYV